MNGQRVEIMKKVAAEFGGIQFHVITSPQEIEQRYCAARFCSTAGALQLEFQDEQGQPYYRVACKAHAIRTVISASAILGDSSFTADARAYAQYLEVDWAAFLRDVVWAEPIRPQDFRCIECGGNLVAETVGMKAGRRWVHTCEVPL